MRTFHVSSSIIVAHLFLVLGCSQGSGAKPAPAKESDASGGDRCVGFELAGLKYSPGGTTLPHPCEPFDAVTNNPYAVRCVDAMPDYKTPYAGDDFCILPPPPDQGIQLGAHPQGADYWARMYAGDYSGYADADATAPFEVQPGAEIVQTYNSVGPNTEEHDYFRLDSRMRPGSHHLASYVNSTPGTTEGWEPVEVKDQFARLAANPQFYNVQNTHSDRPSALDVAPEDEGLGSTFAANTIIGMQLHHINTTLKPLLREVWINVWWMPGGGKATQPIRPGVSLANIDYPPNQIIDNVGTYAPSTDTRVLSVFGHRHAWTTRFSAELIRASGETEEMYDSFDWIEMPTYQLDSVTQNPAPNPALKRDGAISGETILHPGDQIKFHCYVDTTARQAAALNVSVPTANLAFDNQSIGAEMCVLYLETAPASK